MPKITRATVRKLNAAKGILHTDIEEDGTLRLTMPSSTGQGTHVKWIYSNADLDESVGTASGFSSSVRTVGRVIRKAMREEEGEEEERLHQHQGGTIDPKDDDKLDDDNKSRKDPDLSALGAGDRQRWWWRSAGAHSISGKNRPASRAGAEMSTRPAAVEEQPQKRPLGPADSFSDVATELVDEEELRREAAKVAGGGGGAIDQASLSAFPFELVMRRLQAQPTLIIDD